MKLNHLSDQALLENTLVLVKREKEILSEILIHLQEVQRRRLYCELSCGSLFQYCVKYLGYSEDQTYRRINALKLIREIPTVHDQISKGELTLSTLTVAQSLFKLDANVNRREVLSALTNKSKREAEKIVSAFSLNRLEQKRQIHLSLNPAQEEKWQAVKAKLAHYNLSEEEIFERMCDQFLTPPTAVRPAPPRSSATKSIPKALRREVFRDASHQCSNCGSRFALEIDHKLPQSLGGGHDRGNLRILCRSCNQRAAIKILGIEKMKPHLDRYSSQGKRKILEADFLDDPAIAIRKRRPNLNPD